MALPILFIPIKYTKVIKEIKRKENISFKISLYLHVFLLNQSKITEKKNPNEKENIINLSCKDNSII